MSNERAIRFNWFAIGWTTAGIILSKHTLLVGICLVVLIAVQLLRYRWEAKTP
jgi:hypothetical protein